MKQTEDKSNHKRYNFVLREEEAEYLDKTLSKNHLGITDFVRISMYALEETTISFKKIKVKE